MLSDTSDIADGILESNVPGPLEVNVKSDISKTPLEEEVEYTGFEKVIRTLLFLEEYKLEKVGGVTSINTTEPFVISISVFCWSA